MFSCRAAWQRCGPLALRAAYRLPRDVVQRRQMSSVSGGSKDNIIYALLCGTFVGAVTCGFSVASSDKNRHNRRVAELGVPEDKWGTPKRMDDAAV